MSVLATPANMKRYARPSRTITGPSGSIVIAPQQPIAYSEGTGETCSASPGDYWQLADDEPLTDSDGEPMTLVFEVHSFRDVDTDDD